MHLFNKLNYCHLHMVIVIIVAKKRYEKAAFSPEVLVCAFVWFYIQHVSRELVGMRQFAKNY